MSISRNKFKLIAIICMTIQHCLLLFGTDKTSLLLTLLSCIGSAVPIIMGFFLVEGYIYTSDRKKYFLRLLIVGFISQLPYDIFTFLCDRAVVIYPFNLNIMLTFILCFLLLIIYDLDTVKWLKYLLSGIILVFSFTLASYDLLLPVMTLTLYHCRKTDRSPWIAYGLAFLSFYPPLIIEYISVSAGLVTWLGLIVNAFVMVLAAFTLTKYYSGGFQKSTRFPKWFFYIYYPSHMLLLSIIMILFAIK